MPALSNFKEALYRNVIMQKYAVTSVACGEFMADIDTKFG